MKRQINIFLILIMLSMTVFVTSKAMVQTGNTLGIKKTLLSEADEKENVTIYLNEDGLFMKVFDESSDRRKEELIKIQEVDGGIFKSEQSERYFSKIGNENFLEVGRVKFDLESKDSIK